MTIEDLTPAALLFIRDILEAIENIEDFIGKMDFNQFNSDEKTRSAVVWKIGIIGEAAKNIPKNIKDRHKELPWREMARMRDKISHKKTNHPENP